MAKQKTQTQEEDAPPQNHEHLPSIIPSIGGGAQVESNAAAGAFMEEVRGPRTEPTSLSVIHIEHKEAMFKLPSGDLVPKVSGYPIYYFTTRRFYEKLYQSGKSQPPDCWSADGVVPHPSVLKKVADACYSCPKSEWGSGKTERGQACAQMVWVFLLNPAFGSPPVCALICPPSSIKAWMGAKMGAPGYFGRAKAKYKIYELVWTDVFLEQAGDIHCVVRPEMAGVCTNADEGRAIAGVRNQLLSLMETMRGSTAEMERTGGEAQ